MRSSMVLLALLIATPALAQHGTGPIMDRTFNVLTRIVEVSPEGVTRPMPGVVAWLSGSAVRPTPHGPQFDTVGRWKAVSNDNGFVAFKDAKYIEKASYQVLVAFQGVSYRSDQFRAMQPPPEEVRVYHVSATPKDLSLRVHWTLDVGESFIRVQQLVRVHNDSLETLDYVHSATGLRMPTLSYMIGEQVLTWGVFPPGKVHGGEKPSTGQGRLEGEKGAVVYRGPVPPGSPLFFQFSYNIPYEDEQVRLGVVSDIDMSDAAMTVRWTDRVYPRARLDAAHRAVNSSQESMRRNDLLVRGRVLAGEPLILTLDRLPVQTKVPLWFAKAGTAAGVVLFLLFLIGHALRRRWSAAEGSRAG